MTRIWVTLDRAQLNIHIDQVGKAAVVGTQRGIEQTLNEAKDELGQGGDPITYPVMWDSDKQRRAYFATNGFGAGIPYARSGNLEHGYIVTPLGTAYAAGAKLSSEIPSARYVVGTGMGESQSRIHQGRWKLFRNVVLSYVPRLIDNVRSAIDHLLPGGS